MKLPIILYDNGDINIFQSIEDAENYIESPDVIDCTYEVYDAEGRNLELIVPKAKAFKFWGIEISKVDKVSIVDSNILRTSSDRLRAVLAEFLQKQNISKEYIDNATLSELIVKCLEILGYSR